MEAKFQLLIAERPWIKYLISMYLNFLMKWGKEFLPHSAPVGKVHKQI